MNGSGTHAAHRAKRRGARSIMVFALVLVAAACGSAAPKATSKVRVKTAASSATDVAGTTATTSAATTTPATAAPTYPPAAAVTSPPTAAPTSPPATATPTTAELADSIHLTGEPGVTPAELQRADTLIAETIVDLKRYQSPAEAYAAGYRSIGDAVTGDEHYTNWSYVNDGHILDPMKPESVVYEVRDGKQTAVAAMYSLPLGSTFADVPDVGGSLTQWHVHRNLCLTKDPEQRVVSGITTLNGTCPPGTSKAGNTPMLHVWITPNPCGPFAALEGIGAGQVPAGQTRNCDTVNASVP